MDNPEKSLKIPKGHSKMDNPDINCQRRVHKIIGKQTQNVNKTWVTLQTTGAKKPSNDGFEMEVRSKI